MELRSSLKVASPLEFDTYFSAVIDKNAFNRISGFIDHAKNSSGLSILGGGQYDDSIGYYIQPTIVETKDPKDKIITEEIFGPVLSVYVYKDSALNETMDLVSTSTKFALTGAIFGQDE